MPTAPLHTPFDALAGVATGASAVDVARAMAVDPDTIYDAVFVEVPPSGTPTGTSDDALAGFPVHGSEFAILTTGNAAYASYANDEDGLSADNGGANVRGNSDYDVVVLKVQLVSKLPHHDACVSVDFRFLSEEFPEFVGTSFNDAFVAESAVSSWTTKDSVITAPNNFVWRGAKDFVSINQLGTNEWKAAAADGTTYDGATPHFRAAAVIAPVPVAGTLDFVYEVYFSIFDQGDRHYDSAVFLDRLDLFYGTCVTGAMKIAD